MEPSKSYNNSINHKILIGWDMMIFASDIYIRGLNCNGTLDPRGSETREGILQKMTWDTCVLPQSSTYRYRSFEKNYNLFDL
jgi:hypothetical protein